jgi:site-specific DNA-methyltransferase (adenine-specific)
MNVPIFKGGLTTLGAEIRALRRHRRISQVGLAEAIGVVPDTVAGLEAGRGTLTSLVPILNALDGRFDGQPVNEPLSKWIRQLRQARHLSQEKAALVAGLAKRTVIALEREHGNLMSLVTLLKSYGVVARIVPRETDSLWPSASQLFEVHHGDAGVILKLFEDAQFDAVITDPPYGLGELSPALVSEIVRAWSNGLNWDAAASGFKSYMRSQGQKVHWDDGLPQPSVWAEVLRTLKPGAHAFVFSAPRTSDLISLSLRLAGFEIRDHIVRVYGTGLRMGMNVGGVLAKRHIHATKPADEVAKVFSKRRRFPVPGARGASRSGFDVSPDELIAAFPDTAPIFEEYGGIRGHLKPAHEVVIVARKPLENGNLSDNVVRHRVGGINVGAARRRHQNGFMQLPTNVWDELGELPRYFHAPRPTREELDRYLPEGMTNSHPSAKPISILSFLLRISTQPGALVLDPFAGSGSTGCACIAEGRRFVGTEIDRGYAEVAQARVVGWAAHSAYDK